MIKNIEQNYLTDRRAMAHYVVKETRILTGCVHNIYIKAPQRKKYSQYGYLE